ncbi:MAG: TIGR00282 family metallophosphoesterase [Oscillospiraceae bacterium]|nr:TIGR00282 family metallophosphoesterase [Oscillospiraceae bacterium]
MKILVIGDIIGKSGLERVKQDLPKLIETEKIDFVIANGENVAEGMGITEKDYKELLTMNVDVVTMGNHTWAKKDIFNIINESRLIRPANYPANVPGHGYGVYGCNNKKIAIINLIGRVEMNVLSENPFLMADDIISKLKAEANIIIIDFHAEATAEKKAMGYYLDGKITIMFGTHTHVQTADEQILPNGTAYITDIGMTGAKNSIIGMDIEASTKRFVTSLPERYKVASGDTIFNGVIFEINDETNQIERINRINC